MRYNKRNAKFRRRYPAHLTMAAYCKQDVTWTMRIFDALKDYPYSMRKHG
jgi:hypothetical protein